MHLGALRRTGCRYLSCRPPAEGRYGDALDGGGTVKLRSFVLLVVAAALLVAVLAPAAFASAGVKMELSGPREAGNNAMIKLTCKISNPQKADGNRTAVIMQNKDGHLKRIGSKAITWTDGGKTGVVTFWVKAQPTAMGIAKYRAAWMHPEGTTRTNVWSVEID